jgi:thiamine phosphate synthase YjbQ (UPF0047 family)
MVAMSSRPPFLGGRVMEILHPRCAGLGEQIFYGEFDGQRTKRVLVKVIGE